MLWGINQLNSLFEDIDSIDLLLNKIVTMVSEHMASEACSIYIYDEETDELTLRAVVGLNQACVNRVRLKIGEGIPGTSINEIRPICEKVAMDNPNFKFIPDLGDELFESIISVPITRGKQKIGVITLQRHRDNPYTNEDTLALQVTASQVGGMIENAKILLSVQDEHAPHSKKNDTWKTEKFIKGKPASQGFAHAKTFLISNSDFELNRPGSSSKKYGLEEFKSAVIATERQLEYLQKKVEEQLSDAASLIFAAHIMMLKDKSFIGGINGLIENGKNASEAVVEVFGKYRDIFAKSPSPLIREKVQDLRDLVKRILENLTNADLDFSHYRNKIAISKELLPSDLLMMSAEGVCGIILVSGGVTSHVAILTRSLHIPLVIIDNQSLLTVPDETDVIIDAESGNIFIEPDAAISKKFDDRNQARKKIDEERTVLASRAETTDGFAMKVMLNVNLLSDVPSAGTDIIDGIGLYRTEFPFLIRVNFPTEEEQYAIYKKLIESANGKSVTFRTLDIGGDKVLSYFSDLKEQNPFLGMRSIRFSLNYIDIFKQQLKAILRATYEHESRIMFPMISSKDELIQAKAVVAECISDLKSAGIPHNPEPVVGVMIELPSAVSLVDDLADESAFFSIGTNDLIQYTLAVDRTNEKVSHLYVPHHPAVLRSLKKIADSGKKFGREVAICGDMANSEKYIPFLIGIGIDTFSVDAIYIPRVKKTISSISKKEAEKLAKKMLKCSTVEHVTAILESH